MGRKKLKSFWVIILYLVLRFCQSVLDFEHNLDAIMNNSVLICILYSWKITKESEKDLKPQANRHLWCFTTASVGNSGVLHFLALAKHLDVMVLKKWHFHVKSIQLCHSWPWGKKWHYQIDRLFEKTQENLFAVLPPIVHGVVKLFNWCLNLKY